MHVIYTFYICCALKKYIVSFVLRTKYLPLVKPIDLIFVAYNEEQYIMIKVIQCLKIQCPVVSS